MDFLSSLNYIEVIGVITGFICVYLNVKQNIWCWPFGLISVGLFMILFYQSRLYADTGLQAIYIVLSLYGWHQWLYGGPEKTALNVSRLSLAQAGLLTILCFVSTGIMGWLLAHYTDADLPYWDSLTTAMSLIAQWLLAKKMLENWVIWISVDVLYIVIYAYKGLHLTSFLYVTYLLLSIWGFLAWKQSATKQLVPA